MANDLDASFPSWWSRRMQRIHVVKDRYRPLVSMAEKGMLKKGDVVDRPYRSSLVTNDMGDEGSYSRQAITDAGETLTINKKKETSFYIQSIDEIQSNYKTRNLYAKDAAVSLGNQIDGDVFGEYDAADSIVDDGDMGGTAGSATRPHDYGAVGLTLSSSNVLDAVLAAAEKMDALNIDTDKRFGATSPQFLKQLRLYVTGRQTGWGDKVGQNGVVGRFENFEMVHSNNLSWTARLEMGTKPIDGDTITINGVTLTFKDAIGTAGYVMICDSGVAETLDNLVLALNTPGTAIVTGADAGYTAVSAANQKLLKNITAYDGTTYLGIEKTGTSFCVVSEVLTAPADIWTANKQIQHNLFGRKGAIDLVIQKYANMNAWHRDGYIGHDIVTWQVYGIKTFDEGDAELVDVQIRSDAF
jgi:hypothetical protein